MRKTLFLFLFLLSTALFANAQSDTSYQLLWYRGKKIKTNLLLTPAGDTIRFNPTPGTVSVTAKPGSNARFMRLQQELKRTPQRTQEMITHLAAALPKTVLPSYSYALRSSFKEVQDEFDSLASNTLQLPDTRITIPSTIGGKGAALTELPDAADPFDDVVKEFRDYIASHQEKIQSVPVPPRTDLSYCNSCNAEGNTRFNNEMAQFQKEMQGDDGPMIRKAFAVSRQAQLFLDDQRCAYVEKECRLIMSFIFQRMQLKTELLIEKYIDNAEYTQAVLLIALAMDRQAQLTGLCDPPGGNYITRAWDAFANALRKAMNEKDYAIALNLKLLFATERQMQLLGTSMGSLFDQVISFNQFRMGMNVSAKMAGDGAYTLAQLKGDNWFYAVPDSTCHLRWILVGPYVNKLKVNLLAADMRGNGGQLTYVGTKTWNGDIPAVKIDFCRTDEKKDSVVVYPFHPEDFKEMWQLPQPLGSMNVAVVNSVLLGCFIDEDRLREEVNTFSNSANVEKLKQEMMAKYQKMMKEYQSGNISAKGMSLQALDAQAATQKTSREISELMHTTTAGRYIFEPVVHTKDAMILQEKLNGKEIFPRNTATEYAWFFLTLEHDPNGPYGLSMAGVQFK